MNVFQPVTADNAPCVASQAGHWPDIEPFTSNVAVGAVQIQTFPEEKVKFQRRASISSTPSTILFHDVEEIWLPEEDLSERDNPPYMAFAMEENNDTKKRNASAEAACRAVQLKNFKAFSMSFR